MAGLRERKKAETRRNISDIATGLFLARGYANVTVAEVAEAAGVSKMTVFNYFATKEDLLLDRQPENIEMLRDAVLNRGRDQSVSAALREWCQDMLAARHPMAGIGNNVARFWNEVMTNQDLRNRSLQQAQELGDAIADVLVESVPDNRWHAEAVAQLLGAAIGTVFATAIKKQMSGVPVEQVRAEQIDVIDATFDLLDQGLARYGA
jgi:AcrR family transcriptional regulator